MRRSYQREEPGKWIIGVGPRPAAIGGGGSGFSTYTQTLTGVDLTDPAVATAAATAVEDLTTIEHVESAVRVDRVEHELLSAGPTCHRVRVGNRLAANCFDLVDDLVRRAGIFAGAVDGAPRSLTTTWAPSAARSNACSRPSPRPAPVTTHTRPSSSPIIDLQVPVDPHVLRSGDRLTACSMRQYGHDVTSLWRIRSRADPALSYAHGAAHGGRTSSDPDPARTCAVLRS